MLRLSWVDRHDGQAHFSSGVEGGGTPVELSVLFVCFNPLNLCRNTQTSSANLLCPCCATQIQKMSVLGSQSYLWASSHLLTAGFCHMFSQIGWHCIRVFLSLNWDSPWGFCEQRTQSVCLSRSTHPQREKHCCRLELLSSYYASPSSDSHVMNGETILIFGSAFTLLSASSPTKQKTYELARNRNFHLSGDWGEKSRK